MQTDITFKNLDSSDALKDYAIKRLSKIDKYIERTAEAHVVLSVEKRRHKADVTLTADGTVINAVEITEDLYAAIDMVMDKLERQFKKHKQKIQGGKKIQGKAPQEEEAAEPLDAKARPRVVYEKNYFVKPMSLDEAILQMNLTTENYLIFQNTESNQISLLYKRQDGDLALVEPQI
ncbi:MAG TPA: ribosome-associated translation inhibitor RaiA [Deltaproteobacteria bacterium]|nr:ribosome-associated translation inhibitor RaiA [Deltaproteobacteria bacterium]